MGSIEKGVVSDFPGEDPASVLARFSLGQATDEEMLEAGFTFNEKGKLVANVTEEEFGVIQEIVDTQD